MLGEEYTAVSACLQQKKTEKRKHAKEPLPNAKRNKCVTGQKSPVLTSAVEVSGTVEPTTRSLSEPPVAVSSRSSTTTDVPGTLSSEDRVGADVPATQDKDSSPDAGSKEKDASSDAGSKDKDTSSDAGSKNKDTSPEADVYGKTLYVKDLCTIIGAITKTPGIELTLFEFSHEGMMIYSRPGLGPVLILSFWHRELFQEFRCTQTVRKWLHKTALENLRKKINRVEYLEIQILQSDVSGLSFSGIINYDTGGVCRFQRNLFDYTTEEVPIEIDVDLPWHVRTSSQQFQRNIDFMQSDCVSMRVRDNKLTFEGISETFGLVEESIKQKIEVGKEVEFQCLFYLKYLRVVAHAHVLNGSLMVSFNNDQSNGVAPVLFSYALDHEDSHFSIYVLPFVEEGGD